MIKKISVQDLRPGMYVHDLDCGWMAHPFLYTKFRVDGERAIRRIAEAGIRKLDIDTSKGLDVDLAPTRAEVDAAMECKLRAPSTPDPLPPRRRSADEEFHEARNVHSEANRVIRNLLHDARLGKQVSVEQAEPVVEKLADSILRNPGPMLALCRIKTKDEYTFMHSVSVGALMMAFTRAAGMDEKTVRETGLGGLLHDIGKMTTPDEILNKPGKLTNEEFVVMRNHVVASREVLEKTRGITLTALDVAAQHHERFDGSGYPLKLKGAEISRVGQMAAIVDVYDAITSDRVYHKGMQAPVALKKILEWTHAQFNPELVRIFVAAIGIYPTGTLVMLESGRLAVVMDHDPATPHRPRVRVVYDTTKSVHLTPVDVDLARSAGHGGGDRVLRHEPPRKWSIDPLGYLG